MKTINFITILLISSIVFGCKKKDTKPEESEVIYTNFKILSVKITAMPFIDGSNTSWDPFDGPDVFFNMETSTNTVLLDGSGSKMSDISPSSLPLIWNFVNAYQITNLNVTHFVTVYDYDTIDPNDLIGYIGFNMNDHKNGYPKTITKTSGNLTISITGEWY